MFATWLVIVGRSSQLGRPQFRFEEFILATFLHLITPAKYWLDKSMKIQALWNTYFAGKVMKSVNSVLNLQGGDGKDESIHKIFENCGDGRIPHFMVPCFGNTLTYNGK